MKHLRMSLAVGLLAAAPLSQAATVYAVDTLNRLYSFDHLAPGTTNLIGNISGIAGGEVVLGIDFRPANGLLYALGSTNTLYTLNQTTGVATKVGSGIGTALSGSSFGFDFNPVPDRVRVVSDTTQNLRLNPNTGSLAANDPAVTYGTSVEPNIVGVAYTNNDNDPSTGTSLYGIDYVTDQVVFHSTPAPSFHNVTPQFSLGVDTSDQVGFDIGSPSAGGNALALASLTTGNGSGLYLINLAGQSVNFIGTIGDGSTIRDIAIAPVPVPAAVWLLGSAALAMLGVRRREA